MSKEKLFSFTYDPKDEGSLKALIVRYQQKIFALVLYLIGGNRDIAYKITTVSFVEVLRQLSIFRDEITLRNQLIATAIEKSRSTKAIPIFDGGDFENLSAEGKKSLLVVKRALQVLPFDTRVLVLLRDQLHLLYKDIAEILNLSESEAKIQITRSRIQLRKKIEEILSHTQ